MEPHQQRVVDEQKEPEDKTSKLRAFLGTPGYANLPVAEQHRLCRQERHMSGYNDVLLERIEAF